MKERLRREYYGLGGSPNQVRATAVGRQAMACSACVLPGLLADELARWLTHSGCAAGHVFQLLPVDHAWRLLPGSPFQADGRALKPRGQTFSCTSCIDGLIAASHSFAAFLLVPS